MRHREYATGTHHAVPDISTFAAEVVARLIARDGTGAEGLRETMMQRLMEALGAPRAPSLDMLRPEMRRARVPATLLADAYIPEAARRLGAMWHGDGMSFADVSIGSARLQALLREIGGLWSADRTAGAAGPTVLLMVPGGEQHTLGALAALGRLRRAGVSTCLRIGPDAASLRELLAGSRFDAVFLSVGCRERLETCADLVKTLKRACGPVPVAIGGAVTDGGGSGARCPGAEIVTNDLDMALEACGLAGRVTRAWKRA